MNAYRVVVSGYNAEFDFKGGSEYQSWSALDYEDALLEYNEIVNNIPDQDGEHWINEKDEFIYYFILAANKNVIKLPIVVSLELAHHSYKLNETAWKEFTKGRYGEFAVIKEEIVWPAKHHALEEAII